MQGVGGGVGEGVGRERAARPVGAAEFLIFGDADAEEVFEERREAEAFESGEAGGDGGVVAVDEGESEVAVEAAEVVVAAVQDLLDAGVAEGAAQSAVVEVGERVHQVGLGAVGELDEADLLRVAVAAVGLRVDGERGGGREGGDGGVQAALGVNERVGVHRAAVILALRSSVRWSDEEPRKVAAAVQDADDLDSVLAREVED